MCVFSAVLDYPVNVPSKILTGTVVISPGLFGNWDYQTCLSYVELIEKAKEFDRLNQEPNCEDPKKKQRLKELEQRVTNIGLLNKELAVQCLELVHRISKL